MEALAVPDFSVNDIMERLAQNVGDDPLRERIEGSSAHAIQKEADFQNAMAAPGPYAFPRSQSCHLLVKSEMIEFYEAQMAKTGGHARSFYNAILGLAVNDRCPFCRVGVVTTVDHYLPKAKYVDLAITPLNLLPCCRDCNSYKHVRYREQQTTTSYTHTSMILELTLGFVAKSNVPTTLK